MIYKYCLSLLLIGAVHPGTAAGTGGTQLVLANALDLLEPGLEVGIGIVNRRCEVGSCNLVGVGAGDGAVPLSDQVVGVPGDGAEIAL